MAPSDFQDGAYLLIWVPVTSSFSDCIYIDYTYQQRKIIDVVGRYKLNSY